MSQQLLRKLIKATSVEAQDAAAVQGAEIASKKPQRKRTPQQSTDGAVSEDAIVAWHTKLLLATDRKMSFSRAKSTSNAAAMGKLQRRREREMKSMAAARLTRTPTGAARTTTSKQPELVQIPTFNKERHEKERQERKQMKLANALEKLHSTKKSKTRKSKTIFG